MNGSRPQYTLRALLISLTGCSLLLGLVARSGLDGAVQFAFVAGTALIAWGLARRRPGAAGAGAETALLAAAYFLIDAVGSTPLVVLGVAASVVLACHDGPERPRETWLALGALLGCGLLGALVYAHRLALLAEGPVFRPNRFCLHLCAGLTAGILMATPYAVIRIVLIRAAQSGRRPAGMSSS